MIKKISHVHTIKNVQLFLDLENFYPEEDDQNAGPTTSPSIFTSTAKCDPGDAATGGGFKYTNPLQVDPSIFSLDPDVGGNNRTYLSKNDIIT